MTIFLCERDYPLSATESLKKLSKQAIGTLNSYKMELLASESLSMIIRRSLKPALSSILRTQINDCRSLPSPEEST